MVHINKIKPKNDLPRADHLDMTMTVNRDFKPKTKEPKIGLQGSVIFTYNVEWSEFNQKTGPLWRSG